MHWFGMQRVLRASVMFAALAPFAGAAPAADAPPAAGDAADVSAILPYVDEGTYLVARLDVNRVDLDAWTKYMEKASDAMLQLLPIPANQRGMAKGQTMQSIGQAKQWMTSLVEAGGKRLYLLADTTDLAAGEDDPVVVVPFGNVEEGERIKGLMGPARAPGRETAFIGNAVVNANSAQLERLRKRLKPGTKPVERPDFARAFAAAGGDAPLRVAIAPGEASRAWVDANLPLLPEAIGGGDAKALARRLRYASFAVAQKADEVTGKVTLRCTDADAAAAVLGLLNKAAAFVKESAADEARAEEIGKEVDAMQPKLNGDTITLNLDPILVLTRFARAEMASRGQAPPAAAPAQPAEPPKPDDGGL